MVGWEGKRGMELERRDVKGRMGREIQLTRFALPYDYTCFADVTSFVQEIFV